MPLGDVYPNSVVFVCEAGAKGSTPVGTAFLVEEPNGIGGVWRYVITARHVVEHDRPTTLRLRRHNRMEPVEIPISEWIQHPTADAAVAPFDFDPVELQISFVTTEAFADKWLLKRGVPIQPGDPVFLIGLLSDLRSMVERSIPMVRSGRLGALYQEDIPVRQGQSHRIEPRAHLIDAHSRAGFSGAPCVVEHLSINVTDATVFPYLTILGVVVGHFDSYLDVLSRHGEGEAYETDLRIRDNQGVAVVVPIEAVREVLEGEALVEDRSQKVAKEQGKQEG
jgi:hypothetical protein